MYNNPLQAMTKSKEGTEDQTAATMLEANNDRLLIDNNAPPAWRVPACSPGAVSPPTVATSSLMGLDSLATSPPASTVRSARRMHHSKDKQPAKHTNSKQADKPGQKLLKNPGFTCHIWNWLEETFNYAVDFASPVIIIYSWSSFAWSSSFSLFFFFFFSLLFCLFVVVVVVVVLGLGFFCVCVVCLLLFFVLIFCCCCKFVCLLLLSRNKNKKEKRSKLEKMGLSDLIQTFCTQN